MSKIWSWVVGTGILLFGSAIGFYFAGLNHVSVNEIGVAYDSMSGQITIQDKPGWYRTSPMVRVAYIGTLPIKVQIPSEAAVINMRVVRFKKEGVDEFIRLQGFHYSLNSSLPNIMLGYAYSGQAWSFLEVMQMGSAENANLPPLYKKP